MDLNKIGLMIGVLALILAVPLSVAANLLTPWLRDRWSASSQTRTLRRIRDLETKLRAAESEWKFTPPEWSIRQGVRHALSLVMLGFHCIFSTLLIILLLYRKTLALLPITHPALGFWEVGSLILMGYVANLVYGMLANWSYMQTRQMHSTSGVAELKKELNKLMGLVE